MNRLLKVELIRLWNSVILKLGMLFSGGLAVFIILARWLDVRNHPEYYAALDMDYRSVDGVIFIGGLYLTFAFAVEICVFVGTEYSDGTIRNKLIAGRDRVQIYLSELFVGIAANLMIYLLYLVLMLGFGGHILGIMVLQPAEIFRYALLDMAAIVAFTAFLTAVTMLISSKAVSAIVCLLATVVMLLCGVTIYQDLKAPEYYDTYASVDGETGDVVTYDTDSYADSGTGEEIHLERQKNYHYVTGIKRQVYTFLNNFLPVSQLYQVGVNDVEHFGRMAVYDGFFMAVVTGVGIFLFGRKNLK